MDRDRPDSLPREDDSVPMKKGFIQILGEAKYVIV